MLNFTDNDKRVINEAYKAILFNLKYYLQQYNHESGLENSKIIINMLHNGLFSANAHLQLDNDFDYISLPSSISQGIQVMYSICCCRHATEFVYDSLKMLGFNPSITWFLVDNSNGIWRKADPIESNHTTILYDNEYIIDPANKLILRWQQDNGQIDQLDIKISDDLKYYRDDNIDVIAKVLKKYYTYRELGIENVYDYS